jgi:hypothetical protein
MTTLLKEEVVAYLKCYDKIFMQELNKNFWGEHSIAQHSGELLLAFVSTVALSFGPDGSHDQIFARSETIYVFGNGFSSLTRRGVGLCE